MKILVTGSNGFIGKHMCAFLKRKGDEVLPFDIGGSEECLIRLIRDCDAIIHLAGINRPTNPEEYYKGNFEFSKKLADLTLIHNPNALILMSSSIQAESDNDYGKSKKAAEDYLLASGLNVLVFRLANVFGKWCRPNYNSVCATFCYNIAHVLPIEIRDPEYVVHFQSVEDVIPAFYNAIHAGVGDKEIHYVEPIYDCSLGKLASLIRYFKQEIESPHHLPIIHDRFELLLFKTFCDYATEETNLNFTEDERGSFEEIYKSKTFGQISENIAYPGITKGGHYHTYKNEIFYTVIGQCRIKERSVLTNEALEYEVDGGHPQFVPMIPNYTHEIKNVGLENSHTLMWISEPYDLSHPDTFREPV